MAQRWLGLDIGTSSVKAVVIDAADTVLAVGTAGYRSRPGVDLPVGEQDAADYLDAAARAGRDCLAAAGPVDGVGLAGQTPTLVLVDPRGAPVRPALTWQDQRAGAEAAELADAFADVEAHVGTSLTLAPSTLPAKLLWLSRHEPDRLRATRWLLQPKDYVGLHLTGVARSDAWSSKGLCHVRNATPCIEILAHVGADPAQVPPIVSPDAVAPARGASPFGLPDGTPVTAGWSDALSSTMAVGAFERPATFVATGTSDIVGITTRTDRSSATPLFAVPPSCAPLPMVYGPTSAAGAALQWGARLLGVDVPGLLDLALAADPAQVPVFVPYLDGERAPVWRSDLTGRLVELRPATGPAEIAAAVVGGVVCSERHVVDTAAAIVGSPPAGPIRTGGRGCEHPAWVRARAATFARPVEVAGGQHLTAVGAAKLAAAAAGRPTRPAEDRRAGGPVEVTTADQERAAQRYARYRAEVEIALS